MLMGSAWKESTSNGPRPPSRSAVAPPLLEACPPLGEFLNTPLAAGAFLSYLGLAGKALIGWSLSAGEIMAIGHA